MKRFLLPAVALLAGMSAFAEAPAYQWHKLIDSKSAQDLSNQLAMSSNGTFFTLSHFGSKAAGDNLSFDGSVVAEGAVSGTSADNRNLLLMKHDADGKCLWTVSTKNGYVDSADGAMAATADGGVVVSLKVRANDENGYHAPVLVDALKAEVDFPEWNTSCWIYNHVLVKIDAEGSIKWARSIVFDQTPAPKSTKENNVDGYSNGSVALDANGNIYIAGNYRSPMIVGGKDYSTHVLVPRSIAEYTGDSNTAGGLFLIKLDGEGNYVSHIKSTGDTTRDQITSLASDGFRIYFAGNLQGNEGQQLTVGDKTVTIANDLDGMLFGCLDTENMQVSYLKYIKAYGAEDGKHTTQVKNLCYIDGSLYILGAMKGGFGDEASSAAAISSTGKQLEGFAIKLNPADGKWEGAVCNELNIGAYLNGFKHDGKLYLFGYRMNKDTGSILDVYPADSWTREDRLSIVTGGGTPTAYDCAFDENSKAVYSLTRGNKAFAFTDGSESDAPQNWGMSLTKHIFNGTQSASSVVGASTVIRGEEGRIVVEASEPTDMHVVDVKGATVFSATVPAGSSSISLSSGIYIANNTKVVVK